MARLTQACLTLLLLVAAGAQGLPPRPAALCGSQTRQLYKQGAGLLLL
jgi:hypothetical protein